jgi:heme/copper-type cytochrome/quinol oxidase subunit 3
VSTPHLPERPRALRPVFDAKPLPDVVFGAKDVNWWGTIGFMVIEGTTLLIGIATALYLRQNFAHWPPLPTRPPGLLWPTVNTLVLLLTIVPMALASGAAKRYDRAAAIRWLVVASLLSIVSLVLRYLEFRTFNVRWDTNAYGSVLWFTIGIHTTLVLTDLVECATIAGILASDRFEEKYFADVHDSATYQYYLSLSYVVLYAVFFLYPRWG